MKKLNRSIPKFLTLLLLTCLLACTQTKDSANTQCQFSTTQRTVVEDDPSIKAKNALDALGNMMNHGGDIYRTIGEIDDHGILVVNCEQCIIPIFGGCLDYEPITLEWPFPVINRQYLSQYKFRGQNMTQQVLSFPDTWNPVGGLLFQQFPRVAIGLDSLGIPDKALPANIDSLLTVIMNETTALKPSVDAAIESLGNYNTASNQSLDNMAALQGELRQFAERGSMELNNFIVSVPCGREAFQNGFNERVNSLNPMMNDVMQRLANYGVAKSAFNNEISEIIGPFTIIQDRLNSAQRKICDAQNATGFDKKVKVVEAQTYWKSEIDGFIQSEFL
ncbi:hypothetical protein [Roseivirga sp. E12]|uniref:hypothetical protein n=1 Tax=Roseivirga sp. E12 TaxID=2819237 RepID=UPI001ABCC77F|nr:hypothetical protein [Roseivirga sp. E12]MBO3698075.1 hypothetical protein [Roseivirga sp. E12]